MHKIHELKAVCGKAEVCSSDMGSATFVLKTDKLQSHTHLAKPSAFIISLTSPHRPSALGCYLQPPNRFSEVYCQALNAAAELE